MPRITTERITLRFTKPEMDEFLTAFEEQADRYQGRSFFMRRAILQWARGMNSAARVRQRSESGREAARTIRERLMGNDPRQVEAFPEAAEGLKNDSEKRKLP